MNSFYYCPRRELARQLAEKSLAQMSKYENCILCSGYGKYTKMGRIIECEMFTKLKDIFDEKEIERNG